MTLSAKVVSSRKNVSVFSYPSPVVRGTLTHFVELVEMFIAVGPNEKSKSSIVNV